MSNLITLSVVVPCYNEAKNIPLLFNAFKNIVRDHKIELIIVNNGSTDQSASVINKQLYKCNIAKIVNVDDNKGYGHGILAGLKEASGAYIGWIHADMQVDPKSISQVIKIINSNNHTGNLFIKGARRNRSFGDAFFTFMMGWFELFCLNKKMSDINAQPTIFSRSLYDNWKNPPEDFSLDLYAFYTALESNYRIIRFPITFRKRVHGRSSWNSHFGARQKLIWRVIRFSLELRKDIKSGNYRTQS